jgi:hypothetical protein
MTSDFSYKKYSLENLENWMYDAMSSAEASPQEIYDVIVGVVKDNYYAYKQQASQAYELLALLNGNGKSHLSCDKDDPSPECKGAWNSFWEEMYYPEEHQQYMEEELNAMCDKAELDAQVEEIRKAGGYEWTPEVKKDVVTRWIIPVQEIEDADTGKQELFVAFPDDLLEAADLKEGDAIHWINNNDGSFTIRKPTQPLGPDEC